MSISAIKAYRMRLLPPEFLEQSPTEQERAISPTYSINMLSSTLNFLPQLCREWASPAYAMFSKMITFLLDTTAELGLKTPEMTDLFPGSVLSRACTPFGLALYALLIVTAASFMLIGGEAKAEAAADPTQRILHYLGHSFVNPQALLQGMAEGSFLLSGSRALEFFVPGSCVDTSDWDFYTYYSPYCVGKTLAALSNCGVTWDDPLEPLRELVDATTDVHVALSYRQAKELTVWEGVPSPEFAEHLAGFKRGFREALHPGQQRPSTMRITLSEEPLKVVVVSAAAETESSEYQYGGRSTRIITGRTAVNAQKVQLIFARKASPWDLILAFYASSVQCAITSYGAVHLYYYAALKHDGFLWFNNSQHIPSANAAVAKYQDRGWRFTTTAPQLSSGQTLSIRRLERDGSIFMPFRIAPTIDAALADFQLQALKSLAWVQLSDQTSLVKFTRYHFRLYRAGARRQRLARERTLVGHASAIAIARTAINQSPAFKNASVRGPRPEEVDGVC